MIAFLLILCALLLLYLLSLMGRTGHPALAELKKWKYAHRGLHRPGVPENSMAAFRAALEGGFGIELDIHLMADGNLAVIHDSSLKRTAGADVNIEDLTAGELSRFPLEGTGETVPLLSQVLALYQGKAPLIVELKTAGNNVNELCEAACRLLSGYKGAYCLESFDPRCILWLRRHRKDLVRGQLSENSLKGGGYPFALRLMMTALVTNFLTRPDFVAFRYADRRIVSNTLCKKLWRIQGVSWTLKNQQELDTAMNESCIPIFEGFLPK